MNTPENTFTVRETRISIHNIGAPSQTLSIEITDWRGERHRLLFDTADDAKSFLDAAYSARDAWDSI